MNEPQDPCGVANPGRQQDGTVCLAVMVLVDSNGEDKDVCMERDRSFVRKEKEWDGRIRLLGDSLGPFDSISKGSHPGHWMLNKARLLIDG